MNFSTLRVVNWIQIINMVLWILLYFSENPPNAEYNSSENILEITGPILFLEPLRFYINGSIFEIWAGKQILNYMLSKYVYAPGSMLSGYSGKVWKFPDKFEARKDSSPPGMFSQETLIYN